MVDLFVPDWTWGLAGLIVLLTLWFVRLILVVRSLPPGPFPYPIIGNLGEFVGESDEIKRVVNRLEDKYKGIFTLWFGPNPIIFITDWKLCNEALITRKNDFSGRVVRGKSRIFTGGNDDVIFTDFGPGWETLRKILSTAVRKYATSGNLGDLIIDVVDKTSEEMFKDEEPVDANIFMEMIMYNVLASSTFGKRFGINDSDFIDLRENNDVLSKMFLSVHVSDVLPILRCFYRNHIQRIKDLMGNFRQRVRRYLKEHQETFQPDTIRDFTDAVLAARDEAEAEGSQCLKYLTEGNMINLLADLFLAGTETTIILLRWTFLLSCDRPKIINRMQQEIDQNIGSRPPRQDDKYSLPFVQAVITETLRFRPVADYSFEHKTICNTEIAGYRIPKNTSCVFGIRGPHKNPEYWEEPERFNPDRFLDPDGKFSKTRLTGYMPFGLGRRVCPGEKLALADIFLIVVRLLQKYDFELEGGPGSVVLSPDHKTNLNHTPPFNIVVKKRENGELS